MGLLLQFTYFHPAETSHKLAIAEVRAQHFLESCLEITHNARIESGDYGPQQMSNQLVKCNMSQNLISRLDTTSKGN
jgi:hypothetical protein